MNQFEKQRFINKEAHISIRMAKTSKARTKSKTGLKSKTKGFSKSKTSYKKRRYGSSKISAVVVRGKPGFPDEWNTKLVYVTSGTMAGASPTPAAQVFNANSLYDPDSTGGGHQPKYYDQLTAVYAQYLVLGLKYEIQFNNGASTPAFGVVAFNEADTSSRSVESLQENRYAHNVNLGTLNAVSTQIVKGYMSMAKLLGQSHMDQDSTRYAAVGSNPTNLAYLILKVASCDGSSNANVYWKAKLTFYCKFKELTDPGQS